jgi:hypothetical protein
VAASGKDFEKIVARWQPRLSDGSGDVQEEAAKRLADVAAESPVHREQLLPVLFNVARSTKDWVVACNSIMSPTQEIPKTDERWLGAFVDLYIDLTNREETIAESAYYYLADLVTEGVMEPGDPAFERVSAMAKRDINRKTGGERQHIFAILDWIEDNT